jgi:hypothetical protein
MVVCCDEFQNALGDIDGLWLQAIADIVWKFDDICIGSFSLAGIFTHDFEVGDEGFGNKVFSK